MLINWGIIFEVFNNVTEWHVGADDAPEKAEDPDGQVLEELPLVAAEVAPVGGGVDDGRRHDAQRRHLDRAQKWNDQVQPWHGRRQGNWKIKIQKNNSKSMEDPFYLELRSDCNFL